MSAVREIRLTILLLALSVWLAAPAQASQSVKLNVALTPERLGSGTTIVFGFLITAQHGRVPAPLTAIDLLYPANIGLVTSGLGLATCSSTTLQARGPEGCPPDSLMGYGSAIVEIPFGPEIIRETGLITTWMAPIQNGHLALLFCAEGQTPVQAQLIFTAGVLEAPAPYGGRLDTHIPLIPSLPEAPNPAVVEMNTTIGPMNITYYQRSHGKTIAYQPNGLLLPKNCPRGGFPFAATFAFLDGTHASARASVSCPSHR
jgi:hypothetical protein